MNSREKIIVSVGLITGIVVLYWSFVWQPLQKKTVQLQNQVVQYQKEHRYMSKLQQKIQLAREQQQSTPRQSKPKQNPAQVIEDLLRRHKLRQSIKSMSGNKIISLSLDKINMDVLSRFLGGIEKHPQLSILKLEIKPQKVKGRINTKMKIGETP